jgi:hypothetical protein
VASRAVPEKPYELAYEASIRAIEDQANLLDGIRARAGVLLAAAAVVVLSVFAAQAFRSAAARGPHTPTLHLVSYTSGAITAFAGVAFLTLATLLPTGFRFSVDAQRMLEIIERRVLDDPVGAIEAYQVVARQHRWLYDLNHGQIRVLSWCLRGATVCLVAEVALWIVVLERNKP